ncbi:MAG: hypothetical protein CMM67_02365 [Rhodospirillaceae bacterium]|nr:hypothetical protein [Rhodospirillaceae bacterium]OUT80351.1 MAG: hypothetical protein CBB83_02170 [Rhodospirillaceae bacterium TMED23]|tara:strand:- start:44032 stop:45591 length:1560 start_codon:yes stop_codon:yes gene_type:complete
MSEDTFKDVISLFEQAHSFQKNEKWSGAIILYKNIIELAPSMMEAHHNLAICLRKTGKLQDALRYAIIAQKLSMKNSQTNFSLAIIYEKLNVPIKAIKYYKKAIAISSNYFEALNNLGRLLQKDGQLEDAIEILKRAQSIEPNSPSITINIANYYLETGQPHEANNLLKLLLNTKIKLSKDILAIVINTMGVIAMVLGNSTIALSYFERAIQHSPNFKEAHENLALILLSRSEYLRGWEEYEWRSQNKSDYEGKRWKGESLNNKTLLVHTEQGYGDIIQFIRLISKIDSNGGNIVIACPEPLMALLNNCSDIKLVTNINNINTTFDYFVPLMSIPNILKINLSNIDGKSYIFPKYKSRKLYCPKTKFKIGITWSGRTQNQNDPYRNRSCHFFDIFPIFEQNIDANFIILQHQYNEDVENLLKKRSNITDLSGRLGDFEHTASIISNCDLIISIDTYMAHLAGAMGIETWVILPFTPNWRWIGNQSAIWYPKTRLFKQNNPGDWVEPVNRVIKNLADLIL